MNITSELCYFKNVDPMPIKTYKLNKDLTEDDEYCKSYDSHPLIKLVKPLNVNIDPKIIYSKGKIEFKKPITSLSVKENKKDSTSFYVYEHIFSTYGNGISNINIKITCDGENIEGQIKELKIINKKQTICRINNDEKFQFTDTNPLIHISMHPNAIHIVFDCDLSFFKNEIMFNLNYDEIYFSLNIHRKLAGAKEHCYQLGCDQIIIDNDSQNYLKGFYDSIIQEHQRNIFLLAHKDMDMSYYWTAHKTNEIVINSIDLENFIPSKITGSVEITFNDIALFEKEYMDVDFIKIDHSLLDLKLISENNNSKYYENWKIFIRCYSSAVELLINYDK